MRKIVVSKFLSLDGVMEARSWNDEIAEASSPPSNTERWGGFETLPTLFWNAFQLYAALFFRLHLRKTYGLGARSRPG